MNIDTGSLEALEVRIRTILPDLYQDCYEDVQPVSMGSASLKYDRNGKVAWNQIWATFCDLAMAGGPPHKGTLLRPGAQTEIAQEPDRYQESASEICRGIMLVTDLKAKLSEFPGWIHVACDDEVMAGWLVRAIVMENVSAHHEASALFLPVGPTYRIEKEIKNVITVIAKTCHYWVEHMWMSQQQKIRELFAAMAVETPLVAPPFSETDLQIESHQYQYLDQKISQQIGLEVTAQSPGWLGLGCPSVNTAIWLMRALVASNVLSRREGTTLFVPVNEKTDPGAKRVVQTVAQVHVLARISSVN